MIGAFIIGCEILFWVFVLAGLSARYLLGLKRTGGILRCTPVIDLLLIAVTIIDLRGGAEAGFMHGLAAVYIGVTIAFGHRMIQWADARFAHRFAGGKKPEPARNMDRLARSVSVRLVSPCVGVDDRSYRLAL